MSKYTIALASCGAIHSSAACKGTWANGKEAGESHAV